MSNFVSILFYLVLFSFTLVSCASTQATVPVESPDSKELGHIIDDTGKVTPITKDGKPVIAPSSKVEDNKSEAKSDEETILTEKGVPNVFFDSCYYNEAGQKVCVQSGVHLPSIIVEDDSTSPWWYVGGVLLAGAISAGICAASDCYDTTTNVQFR